MIDVLHRNGDYYISVGAHKWRLRNYGQRQNDLLIDATVKALSELNDQSDIIQTMDESDYFVPVELMTKYISVDVLEVLNTLKDWYDDRITKQMVRDLLEDDEIFNEIHSAGMDTVAREMCISELSRKVTGKNWPINGDSANVKAEHKAKWDAYMFEATGCNQDEDYRGKCSKETYGCTLSHE